MDMSKPARGIINEWYEVPFERAKYPQYEPNLGYVIYGKPEGHPYFIGWIRTSAVVKREGNLIETLNSRYLLGTPA